MCAGPVTPSTGPAHTFWKLRKAPKSPFRNRPLGGTMRRRRQTPEPSTRGGRQRLMPRPFRSDRSLGGLVKTHDLIGARRRQDRESGQAMVEFALILLPAASARRRDHPVRHRAQLLARHAADREPGCALGGRRLREDAGGRVCNPTLEAYLEQQAAVRRGTIPMSRICYEAMTGSPAGTPAVGDPVTVRLIQPISSSSDSSASDDRPDCIRHDATRTEAIARRSHCPALGLCP